MHFDAAMIKSKLDPYIVWQKSSQKLDKYNTWCGGVRATNLNWTNTWDGNGQVITGLLNALCGNDHVIKGRLYIDLLQQPSNNWTNA